MHVSASKHLLISCGNLACFASWSLNDFSMSVCNACDSHAKLGFTAVKCCVSLYSNSPQRLWLGGNAPAPHWRCVRCDQCLAPPRWVWDPPPHTWTGNPNNAPGSTWRYWISLPKPNKSLECVYWITIISLLKQKGVELNFPSAFQPCVAHILCSLIWITVIFLLLLRRAICIPVFHLLLFFLLSRSETPCQFFRKLPVKHRISYSDSHFQCRSSCMSN